ncbi:protein ALP1-like [Papaver somniferum]|uniref:protein ALP1-like n=1 Tax=Papaver somniferum TaxID=3469 RepID=UPI000E6F7B03|nr:protein ALP1-like [Papaver somniferum]
MAGSNNDLSVLERSPLFDDIVNGVAPPCNFVVQGHQYDMGYYLSDEIYPQYATLIQTISSPNTAKKKFFAKRQEAVRKDVERAFGVLQARWHIVKGPERMRNVKDIGKIMKTCIILHNMIIEHERQQGVDPESWRPLPDENVEPVVPQHDCAFLVRDKEVHNELKIDLINQLWDQFGDSEN